MGVTELCNETEIIGFLRFLGKNNHQSREKTENILIRLFCISDSL